MPAQSRGNRIFFLSIPLNPPMFLEPLSLFASGRKRHVASTHIKVALCCIMNQLNVSSYSELNRYRFDLSVRQFPSFSNCYQHTWHPREEDNRMSPRTHTENKPKTNRFCTTFFILKAFRLHSCRCSLFSFAKLIDYIKTIAQFKKLDEFSTLLHTLFIRIVSV